MKCKNCGNTLRRRDKFCDVCGTYVGESASPETEENFDLEEDYNEEFFFQEEEEKEVKEEKIQESKPKKNKKKEKTISVRDSSGTRKHEFTYENEALLESYIGEDYKLIKKSPFNFWAFLLNWMYLLYRKLYITGIIGLFISWFFFFSFKKYILIYIVVVMILLGFFFNPYYIFIAKKKVEKIKNKYPDEDPFYLNDVCKRRGGVRSLPAILFYAIFLISIFFTTVPIHFNETSNTKFWEENSENLANCTSLVKASYNNIDKDQVGEVEEALCQVQKGIKKEYEIYFKSKKENRIIYSYYRIEDGYLIFQNNTILLANLELKNKNNTLTEEEEETLIELQLIQDNYKKYSNKSREEDQLIEQQENTEEKVNYILSREEIIR